MTWIDIEEKIPTDEGVYQVMLCDNETLVFSPAYCMFRDGKFQEGRKQEIVLWKKKNENS